VPVAKTFSRAQIGAVSAILARYDGLIVWGGTWSLPDTDGMHLELADGATFEQVTALVAKLTRSPAGEPAKNIPGSNPQPARPPSPAHRAGTDLTGVGAALRGDEGDEGPRVARWQEWLNRYAPARERAVGHVTRSARR
jgi:hypothetical protein